MQRQTEKEIIDSIHHSAMRMNDIVNNLLDMARLESGTVQLNRQWQPLEEVIGSCPLIMLTLLKERPINDTTDDSLHW